MAQLVAIDWGTSSLRGALMTPDGAVLDLRLFALGILSVPKDGFEQTFQSCFGDWMQPAGTRCLMSGMVGSQQGWREAPYCPCPASFRDVATQLLWLQPGRLAIVPGLTVEHGGVPDVMRGEETQIFGALQLLSLHDARLVLPGTHSKWVRVQSQQVLDFSTWMTGEVYALLRQHSILARTLPAEEPPLDAEAFADGVQAALSSSGLLHTAFSVRTLALFKRRSADALASYLSGLVIGEELKAQGLQAGESVVVMGSATLQARYSQALGLLGVRTHTVGDTATWHGLHAMALTLPAL